MKLLMAADTCSAFLDHNICFGIYTDSSDNQMGVWIMQEIQLMAYYSKELNSAQQDYTTTEKEMM